MVGNDMSQSEERIRPSDTLIDEVREIRAKLERQYGKDWEAYAKHINELAAQVGQEFGGTPLKWADVDHAAPADRAK